MLNTRRLRQLLRCDEANAVLEFGLVAPVFLVMLLGVFDVSHTLYSSSVVQGAMQKAGRDFTLENAKGRQTDLKANVTAAVQRVAPAAVVTFEQKAYFDFADVEQEELYDDLNEDGVCNDNEPFEDANENGTWDDDRGQDGIGGARDAVLLTANVRYKRLLPMAGLIGMSDYVDLQGVTVLRNQPFDNQNRSIETGNCT